MIHLKFHHMRTKHKIYSILMIVFSWRIVEGSCAPSPIDKCIKMSTTVIKKVNDACEVSLKETSSDKIWHIRTDECPKKIENKFIDVDFFCDDIGVKSQSNAKINIWDNGECTRSPVESLRFFQNLVKKIKKGQTASALKQYGLHRIATRKIDGLTIWRYHSYPGVSLDIEMDIVCSDETIACFQEEIQKISKIREVSTDFVSKNECLMWGGKPIAAKKRISEFDIEGCELSN